MFNSTITGNLTGDAEYTQVGAYDTAKLPSQLITTKKMLLMSVAQYLVKHGNLL